eukprot:3058063-Rhodomonas_salina.1
MPQFLLDSSAQSRDNGVTGIPRIPGTRCYWVPGNRAVTSFHSYIPDSTTTSSSTSLNAGGSSGNSVPARR